MLWDKETEEAGVLMEAPQAYALLSPWSGSERNLKERQRRPNCSESLPCVGSPAKRE